MRGSRMFVLLDRLDLSASAAAWPRTAGDPERAWARVRRPDVLVALAVRLGVERRIVVRAVTRVIELALPVVPHHPVARRCHEVLVRWTQRDAEHAECRAVESVCNYLAETLMRGDPLASIVFGSMSLLARACDDRVSDEAWARADWCSEAIDIVVEALAPSDVLTGADALRQEVPWTTMRPLVARVLGGEEMDDIDVTEPDPTPRPARRRRP